MIRIAVLGSTRGTNLSALVEAIERKKINGRIDMIISNKASAPILEKARQFGIPSVFISAKGLTREEYDMQLSEQLERHHIDLVVLIGFMRILSSSFISRWQNRVINIHPSLLPAYAGLMDLEVHQAVLNAAETLSGCTVHYVTETVDAGPIVLQKQCPVLVDDTPELLKARVQKMEADLLIQAIQKISLTLTNRDSR